MMIRRVQLSPNDREPSRNHQRKRNNAQELGSFNDVRDLQRQLKAQGVPFVQGADESTTGPASFVVAGPDGHPILVDQHL